MMENSKEVRDVKEDDDDEELTNRVSVNMPIKKSANDFKFIGLIGEGSFSMVSDEDKAITDGCLVIYL